MKNPWFGIIAVSVFILVALAVAPGQIRASPVPGDGANTFDVTPVDSGVVGIGGTFTVDINLVDEGAGTELAYQAAQFQLEWTDAEVDYVSDTPGPVLLPAVPTISSGSPPGTEQIVAAGIQPVPTNAAGVLWSVELACAASSTGPDQNGDTLPDTALDLVSIATAPVFGSATALYALHPMVLEDGFVTCAETADIQVVKDGPATVLAGDTFDYVITMHNAGPNAAQMVIIGDNLPEAIPDGLGPDGLPGTPDDSPATKEYVSHELTIDGAPYPFCSFYPVFVHPLTLETLLNVVLCDLSPLDPFQPSSTAVLTITVYVPLWDAGKLNVNMAGAASQITLDPDLSNEPDCEPLGLEPANGGCAFTQVLPATVDIIKDGPPEVTQGDTWTYDITITSAGPSPATDVEVTDVLPADASYQDNLIVSCVGTGSLLTSAVEPAIGELGGTLVVTVDEMDVGDTCTITFDVRDEGPIGPVRENYNSAEVCWADPLCNMSDTVTTRKVPEEKSITVLKLNDLTFEPLEGFTMTLYQGAGCGGPILDSKVTDASGIVDFTGLPPNFYSVQETVLPGWLPDGPTCQDVDLTDPPPPPPPCPQVPDLPYPDPGCDEFDSGAQINLDLAPIGLGAKTVTLNGLTKVERKNSGTGSSAVQTAIIHMELTGSSPTLGAMTVLESPVLDSVGQFAEQVDTTPDLDFPADSFFDVFIVVEVDLDSNGVPDLVLHNEEPMRLECVIDGIPPILCMYQPPIADPIPLLDELGILRAYIVHAAHIPLPSGEMLVVFSNVPCIDSEGDTLCDSVDPDDDNDGLSDAVESDTGVFVDADDTGTDPLDPDTDGDSLNDGFEVSIGTNPLLADTDGDGFSDRDERNLGSDPLVNGSRPEHELEAGSCTDTLDNDLDTLVDADDPGCAGLGPPPPDVEIDTQLGFTLSDGTTGGIRGWPITVRKTATAVSVEITVEQVDGVPPTIQGLMTDISGGAGTEWEFSYTSPFEWPPQTLTRVTMCADTDGDGQHDDGCQIAGIFLIDPSGVVFEDDTLTPIAGATVTLERFNPVQSTFIDMDPILHAGMFSPEANPELTGADGRYAWDVVTGTYRVQVEKAGCDPATSPSVTVPPPVTDLDVGLTCPDTDGDGLKDYIELELGTDPDLADTDGDGCADGEEVAGAPAPKPGSTGAYDPLAWHDFYDVPVPTAFNGPGGTRDQAVTILNDVLAVLEYSGTSDGGACNSGPDGTPDTADDRCYNQDNDEDTVADGLAYDRSASPDPSPPWDAGPPDGSITILTDVLLVLSQAGLDCSGPP